MYVHVTVYLSVCVLCVYVTCMYLYVSVYVCTYDYVCVFDLYEYVCVYVLVCFLLL